MTSLSSVVAAAAMPLPGLRLPTRSNARFIGANEIELEDGRRLRGEKFLIATVRVTADVETGELLAAEIVGRDDRPASSPLVSPHPGRNH